MKYDFTSILERSGKDAIAVDAVGKVEGFPRAPKPGYDLIPMWVADMNFPTAPSITEVVRGRLDHPAFGYFMPRDEYYQAIIRWQKERNQLEGITPEMIGYENGVLGGVISAMKVICEPGGAVLLHSPTYIGFTHCLTDNHYQIVLSDLIQDDQGIWRMDYADMEEKIKANDIKAAVLCSPHNPTGRVWERWELEKAMALYEKYDIKVICDEIWSDLILEGKHIPALSISEDARSRTIALYAPSKTFNLAGLVGSYHIIADPDLRKKVTEISGATHYNSMNVLSMYALIGGFSREGAEWLDELRTVLKDNVDFACDTIHEKFPGIRLSKPQGTYMLFLDCTDWCRDHNMTIDELLAAGWDRGVAWQDGRPFHGPCHIRMNLALPNARVREAFRRLEEIS
ncbi:MAG: aminotransferase class I/II-fold pyridoxal phosphate-dependent enzyme [Lachnospiraceae bacterium]|nr:aminotransferase class I/II-fold pyridoxal phosphate-dependent enzyme [Lachnospiraceae bacterium]